MVSPHVWDKVCPAVHFLPFHKRKNRFHLYIEYISRLILSSIAGLRLALQHAICAMHRYAQPNFFFSFLAYNISWSQKAISTLYVSFQWHISLCHREKHVRRGIGKDACNFFFRWARFQTIFLAECFILFVIISCGSSNDQGPFLLPLLCRRIFTNTHFFPLSILPHTPLLYIYRYLSSFSNG